MKKPKVNLPILDFLGLIEANKAPLPKKPKKDKPIFELYSAELNKTVEKTNNYMIVCFKNGIEVLHLGTESRFLKEFEQDLKTKYELVTSYLLSDYYKLNKENKFSLTKGGK